MFRVPLICILLVVSLASVRGQGAKNSNLKSPHSEQNQNKPAPKGSPSALTSPSNEASPGSSPSGRKDRDELQLKVETALAQAKAVNNPFNTTNYEDLLRLERRVEEFIRTSERSDASDRELQAEANSLITEAGRLRDASEPTWVSTFLGTTLPGLIARVIALIGIVLLSITVILLLRMRKHFADFHSAIDKKGHEIIAAVSGKVSKESPPSKLGSEALAGKIDGLTGRLNSFETGVLAKLDQLKDSGQKSDQPKNEIAGEDLTDAVYLIPENLSLAELLNSSGENQKFSVSFEIANSVFVPDDAGKLIVITNNHDFNSAILVPKAIQLHSVDQFTNHLEVAYECSNVTVGPVFIVRPATVKRNANGWKLEMKGIIEIRVA